MYSKIHKYGIIVSGIVVVISNILSWHYSDVIMSAMASQITSLTIVYSTFYSGADQRKNKSSASLAFAGNSPVSSPHKRPVTRKMFPFDDSHHVIYGNKLPMHFRAVYRIREISQRQWTNHAGHGLVLSIPTRNKTRPNTKRVHDYCHIL